ncbi:MAG: choice-of-anchor J domain-containing protein [Muribaculaceae bacterium]|nr:choice-of-anchor J domain-containing protein [Muribaculaceae bacterium]
MHNFKSMLLSAAAMLMLAAVPASAAPPQAVKKAPTGNRLYTRTASEIPSQRYSALMKAPRARYISVAEAQADPQLPAIIGGMLDSRSWETSGTAYGLYQLPAKEGEPFKFIRSEIFPNGGGVEADGSYYSCEVEESSDGVSIIIRAYDTDTWRNTRSFSPGDYSFIATDVAHDPLSGEIFGCLWDTSGSGYMFGTIDYKNGVTRKIATLTNMWNAVAIDRDGTIYAIDQEMVENGPVVECVKSSLYTVNRETGALTLIGDTGLLPYYASSAVIDPRTGRMFWSVTPKDDDQSALYEVNKSTGACTLVYRYPGAEQFMGMYVPAPLAEDAAPAAVTDLRANFTGGSLSGTIDFTVPTLTYGGTEGSGAISYDIFTGSNRITNGSTAWGKKESVPVTLSRGGEVEFTVVLTNAAGNSPKEKVKTFAGTDVPKAPEVKAAYADGTMTVTWTVPDGSVNGGYIDPAAITYKVTRMPDHSVVAGATKETSFSETLAVPDDVVSYYYTVEATYDRKTSAAGVSNRIVLGAASAPYLIDFAEVDNLDDVTIINVDPASKGWGLSGGALLLREDSQLAKDDWVITAPIRLAPGSVYAISVEASSQGTRYPETIEIFCGDNNTAEAMTQEIVGPTVVSTASSSAWATITGYYAPESEQTVFIGVHACSEANVYNLRVKSIAITAAFATTAPGAPTDFTVTPDASGASSATISLKAPATDYDGKPLAGLTKLCIYRDGTEIHVKENPALGESITFVDSDVLTGEHTYSAIAFNNAERGREVKTTVFVGVGTPVAPASLAIVETENPGEVHLSWPAVDTDTKGYPLNPELVTYTLYAPNAQGTSLVAVATGITGTEQTLQATDPETQIFAYYAVAAQTKGGSSDAVPSDFIAVGKPFGLPFSETFAGGKINSLFTYTGLSGDWEVVTNNPEYLAQADDNGFAQMFGEYYGSSADLISGKIDLAGSVNPILNFSTFNYYTTAYGPDYNTIEVYVRTSGTEWTRELEVLVNNAADPNRWGAVSVNLSKYEGKAIQLLFRATNYVYDTTTLDQIRIGNGVDHNLSLTSINAPAKANPGEKFNVNVKVENTGLNDAAEFAVQLFRDGELADSRTVETLRSGRSADIAFEQIFTPLVESDVEYHAAIVYNPDMIADDNTSATLSVKPMLSNLPVVPALRGVLSEGYAVLDWDEPDTDSASPDPVQENFETADSYATTSQCGWTFVDADGAPTQDAIYVIGVTDINGNPITAPGIGDNSPTSWAVIDHTYGFGIGTPFTPHSGNKLLIALASDGKANDDWAISPKLFGGAQTITFWAKSKESDPEWAEYGTETFEVLYSTTGTELSDFVKLDTHKILSAEWLQFSADLPEGALYFAVRYVSEDCYSMMIDDFSFIPDGAVADITLMGYNVYCDGGKINDAAVEDNTFTDNVSASGEHSYVVTAIYDKGESRASNIVELTTSGVGSIALDGVSVAVEGRTIAVLGAEGHTVTIAATDGKVLASATAGARMAHTVGAAGVYLVSIEGNTFKVVVR